MPKRPSNSNAVLQRGRTKVQRDAHRILERSGFVFERRSGHGANIYHHPDGRIETVNATPANPGGQLNEIRRRLRNDENQTKGTDMPATTEANEVALYVTMADSFMLKEPRSRLEIQARQQALTGWVKRVLDRHGPVRSADLLAAAEQMGFKRWQMTHARKDLGTMSYVIPGAGIGKGKGSQVVFIAFPSQVPEDASPVGRARTEPETNGVAAVDGEHDGHTESVGVPDFVGDQHVTTQSYPPGQEPGPSLPPPATLDDRYIETAGRTGQEVAGTVVGHDPIPEAPSTPPENDSENRDSPETARARALYETIAPPPVVAVDTSSGEIAAAAQLLLGTLGVKMPGEEARQYLREVDNELARVQRATTDARASIQRALDSLA